MRFTNVHDLSDWVGCDFSLFNQFSHTGYLAHDNQYGPLFRGDANVWKEYTLKVETARGSPPGNWRLESLDLHDKAGNRKHHQFIELLIFSANDY